MIEHQQILYKAKGSRKNFKIRPIYTLPDYDQIQFKSELKDRSVNNSPEDSLEVIDLRYSEDPDFIDRFQRRIYTFINFDLGVKVITTKLEKFCKEIELKRFIVSSHMNTQEPYKGWIIREEKIK